VPLRSPHYLEGTVKESNEYGANSLMIYLGAPQNSFRCPVSILKITEFKQLLKEKNMNIDDIIVHGSYLINLANTANKHVFYFSLELLEKEISRMKTIGLSNIVLHPGSSLGANEIKALLQISHGLNKVLKKQDKVKVSLETMAGKANELGKNF